MPPRKKTPANKIDFNKIAEESGMAERGGWRKRGGAATVDFTEPTFDDTEVAQDEQPTEDATPAEAVVETVTVEESEPVTDVIEQPSEDTSTQAEVATPERKRGPRPAINVGNVVVRPSTRTDFTTRATPTDSNPVFLAAKDAPLDVPTDILVEQDERKIQGALSLLRRAGAKLNLGMHIAPKPYPTEEVDGTVYSVITFKTSAERQVRGKGAVNTGSDSSVSAEDAAAHNAGVTL